MSKTKTKKCVANKLKKWILSLSLSAIVASVLTIGSTLALLLSVSDMKHNEFFPGCVDCEVVETFDGTVKSSIKIQNTGNTDAYIRVSFVSYIQNADGAIVGQSASVPEFDLGENWSYAADGYYYYKLPVASGAMTGEMLASPMELIQKTDANGNVIGNQVVEVFAEAVQAYPKDAVIYAWDSVAAVTGEDDHLAIKIRVYGNYASSAEGAQYRIHKTDGSTVCTTSTEGDAHDYHAGMLNDGYPDITRMMTITPNGISKRIGISAYLVDNIDVGHIAVYFESFDNIQSVEVYADRWEMTLSGGDVIGNKVGVLTKSTETGDYATDVEGYRQLEYTFRPQTTVSANYVGFLITLKDATKPIKLSEIRILGYMDTRDLSPDATYKGESGTVSLPQTYEGTVDTGVDYTNWTDYHAGRLNDKKRSATTDDDMIEEKVMIQCTDNTSDTMRLYFKLEEGSVVNSVDVYAGALATVVGNTVTSTVGDNPISAINVYLSETENQEDWKKLGTVTEGINSGSRFLRRYVISGEALYGNYVIIEIKGTPGKMLFGVNEVQIWSNALLSTDE